MPTKALLFYSNLFQFLCIAKQEKTPLNGGEAALYYYGGNNSYATCELSVVHASLKDASLLRSLYCVLAFN